MLKSRGFDVSFFSALHYKFRYQDKHQKLLANVIENLSVTSYFWTTLLPSIMQPEFCVRVSTGMPAFPALDRGRNFWSYQAFRYEKGTHTKDLLVQFSILCNEIHFLEDIQVSIQTDVFIL